jgi:hypothetical protein
MSKIQRVVLALYFVSLAYCFVWIPWSAGSERLGYGWVWAGPRFSPSPARDVKDFSDVDQFVAEANAHSRISASAMPDTLIILFRVIATTAIAGAVFLLVGIAKRPATPS